MADIEFEINGQKLVAKPGQTIIQVADEAGVYIPRFCYHKHLSIAANCRMCLVEVEKSPKTLPACATPVMAGMKVFTKSQKTIEAQRAVMEFLLINHPLDCPICDQGGECELQDLSMGYGAYNSRYEEGKRSIADQNLGPLISTEMTRCIYCTRCVRFGEEVAGFREMGAIGRGEDTEIGTYIHHAIQSEVSGNIIDLCPVGALTSKPYRFRARAWELDQSPSIAPHDGIGSNINVHTRYGTVLRVVARENLKINETWISDRDRFSYEGLDHPDRLNEPLARIDGEWQVVSWQVALQMAADGLKETLSQHGADKIGGLASPSSTLEECYLLQKIIRGLGSAHVDHRLREKDTRDQDNFGAYPHFPFTLDELETCDAIILVGSNIQKEAPLASLRIRKAALKGTSVLTVNPIDYAFHFPIAVKRIAAPQQMGKTISALTSDNEWATILNGKQKVAVIVGALAQHDDNAAEIRFEAAQLAKRYQGQLGILTDGANSSGAWLAGLVPHRHAAGEGINHVGLSAYQMLEKARKAYLLLNIEPDLDFANTHLAVEALKQAQFVIALSQFRNKVLEAHANVILPMSAFTETSGTYVNVCGEWQSFTGVAKPFQSSRPAWKILRVLGNFLALDGFNYETSEEIKHEVHAQCEKMTNIAQDLTSQRHSQASDANLAKSAIYRIGEIPIYAIDSLVRRSLPLQEVQRIMDGDLSLLRLHPETAQKLQLQEGDQVKVKQGHGGEVEMSVMFDSRLAKDAALIAGGIESNQQLGDLFGEVEISKV